MLRSVIGELAIATDASVIRLALLACIGLRSGFKRPVLECSSRLLLLLVLFMFML